MSKPEQILKSRDIDNIKLKVNNFTSGAPPVVTKVSDVMQAHTNQTLQELKANVKSINKEIDSAIKSQKEADREVPEWLKGQSHAYNAIITLIDEAINE